MDFVKLNYPNNKILLCYRCGSHCFGTNDNKSDEDYVVVLDNFNGVNHIGENKKEYFIFGLNEWIKKMEFDDDIDEYFEIFNDEILAVPLNIITIDESMVTLVNKYKEEFKTKIFKWLTKVYFHFDLYIKTDRVNKTFYHLFRIKSMIDNYLASGSFSLEIPSDVLRKIINFKNSNNKYQYLKEFKDILYYISRLKEDELWTQAN